jgi:phosphoglycolate phosphatase
MRMPDSSRSPIIVFDLDGTLVDSAPDLVATLNFVLKGEGFAPYDVTELLPMIGAGSRTLITRAFAAAGRSLDPNRLQQLHAAFLSHYDQHLADRSRLFPGVEAALDRFAAAGWSFAICTNKVERSAHSLMRELGLADRFKAICGQDTFKAGDAPISKPDPQALLLTVDRAGGDPDRAFMVGDSRTDVETAKAAGKPVIAVDFGYSDRPIVEYRPDRVISSFDALWPAAQSLGLLDADVARA